jgi:hypothetical protein
MFFTFEDLTVEQLKNIIKQFKHIVDIKVSKLNKTQLLEFVNAHFVLNHKEGRIDIKQFEHELKIPDYTPKQLVEIEKNKQRLKKMKHLIENQEFRKTQINKLVDQKITKTKSWVLENIFNELYGIDSKKKFLSDKQKMLNWAFKLDDKEKQRLINAIDYYKMDGKLSGFE